MLDVLLEAYVCMAHSMRIMCMYRVVDVVEDGHDGCDEGATCRGRCDVFYAILLVIYDFLNSPYDI
jgi:hypothetical protein